MKIGISSIGFGTLAAPALIRTLVTNAERLNFSTVWAPEHVVLLDRYTSKYPYSTDGSGQFLAPTEIPIGDPFPTLTYAAACTSRIRLATGICLVPEHNPLVLAKTVATVDYLSGGRFILGVGIGWLAEEFQALGIPFERRAQRTREYIEAMRCLWGEHLPWRVRQFREGPLISETAAWGSGAGFLRWRKRTRIATRRRLWQRLDRL